MPSHRRDQSVIMWDGGLVFLGVGLSKKLLKRKGECPQKMFFGEALFKKAIVGCEHLLDLIQLSFNTYTPPYNQYYNGKTVL